MRMKRGDVLMVLGSRDEVYSNEQDTTGLFAPNRAPGWHVTVPAGTNLVPDSACNASSSNADVRSDD